MGLKLILKNSGATVGRIVAITASEIVVAAGIGHVKRIPRTAVNLKRYAFVK